MTIKQIIEKKQKLLKMCTKTKLAHTFTLRELVKFIGNVVVFIETVPYRKLLFCRQSEREIIKSIQQNKGDFEAKIKLTHLSKKELIWRENKTNNNLY